MKLGVVQLRDILHSLFDVGVEFGVLLLQKREVILIHDPHIDPLQEEDVFQVLQAPNAENGQNAYPIRPEVIDDVAHVFRKSSAGARKPGIYDRHRNVVGLSLFLIVSRRLELRRRCIQTDKKAKAGHEEAGEPARGFRNDMFR